MIRRVAFDFVTQVIRSGLLRPWIRPFWGIRSIDIRNYRKRPVIPHIWEGVYRTFDEVPACGEGHEGSDWVANSLRKIRDLLGSIQQYRSVPPVPAFGASLLPLVAALVRERQERVRILDFGGGIGVTYLQVIAGMPVPDAVEYHIVETEAICRAGREVFRDDNRLCFHSALPSRLQRVDVIHLGSSLHYVDDWKGLISALAAYHPAYFMMTDLPAGEIPTYVTAQNYYGSKMPVRFFNIREIEETMSVNSFALLFRSRFEGTYFGRQQKVPQDNFPSELRLDDTCSLLFRRLDEVAASSVGSL